MSIVTVYRNDTENTIVVSLSKEPIKEKHTGFTYNSKLDPSTVYKKYGLNFGSECISFWGSVGPDKISAKFNAKNTEIYKLFDNLTKLVPSIKREDLESLLKC